MYEIKFMVDGNGVAAVVDNKEICRRETLSQLLYWIGDWKAESFIPKEKNHE